MVFNKSRRRMFHQGNCLHPGPAFMDPELKVGQTHPETSIPSMPATYAQTLPSDRTRLFPQLRSYTSKFTPSS